MGHFILFFIYINYIYQNLLILLRSISIVCYMYVLCSIVCIGSHLLCALSNKIFEFEFVITLKSKTWNNIHLTYLALEEGNGLVGTDLFQFRTPKKTGQMAAKGKLQFN